MWEDNITDMIYDQQELLWNLEDLGLWRSGDEDENYNEYMELRQTWIEYPQDGGRTLKRRTLKSSQTKKRTLKRRGGTKRRTLKRKVTKKK